MIWIFHIIVRICVTRDSNINLHVFRILISFFIAVYSIWRVNTTSKKNKTCDKYKIFHESEGITTIQNSTPFMLKLRGLPMWRTGFWGYIWAPTLIWGKGERGKKKKKTDSNSAKGQRKCRGKINTRQNSKREQYNLHKRIILQVAMRNK